MRGRQAARIGAFAVLVALVALLATVGPAAAAVSQVGSCQIRPHTSCPGANLSGADLAGANLSYANLSGANLAGADLHGSDLRGANLENAHGAGANLSSVHLYHASFRHARLHGINLSGSQLDYANFYYASIDGATAVQTNFAQANLDVTQARYMDASGSNFHGTRVTTADLSHSNLEGANFVYANFHATRLTGVKAKTAVFYPSNFASDLTAVEGVYERVRGHIDAYGDWGSCSNTKVDVATTSDLPVGHCYGTAQPGGSYGLGEGGHEKVSWSWDSRSGPRRLELRGAGGLELHGVVSGNWHAFRVYWLLGRPAEPTEEILGAGEPGGPLAIHLEKRTYFKHSSLNTGYTMAISGWLRRTS